jgi:replication factor A1
MISELTIGQGNVNVEGTIHEIGEMKSFNKFGKELKVANAMLKDDSGSVKLTLWNDDVSRFKDGDKIKIVNGYVNEFQGEKQLTSGKFGSMEKLDGSDTAEEAPAETEETEETPAEETEAPVEPTTELEEPSETEAETEEPKEEII